MSSESVNRGSNAHCLPLVDVNAKLLTERNKNLPAWLPDCLVYL